MTVRVTIHPDLLTWACRRRGVAPAELQARFPRLDAWIDGTVQPTLRQVQDFAAATATPVGYLFLPKAPVETLPIPDLRTVGSVPLRAPSPDLLDTLYLCQRRQDWYRDHARTTGLRPLAFVGSLTLSVDPVSAAARIREALGLTLADQRGQGSWEAAMRLWVERADRLGVLVVFNGVVGVNTHRKLDPDEFRGFALSDVLAPLVFVNSADTRPAQMFSLAHELAHLWCGASALSDAGGDAWPGAAVERWCNAVAAELLVPLEALRPALGGGEGLAEARRLAGVFKVSVLVMLRRLHDAGAMSREEMGRLYAVEVARFRALREKGGGGGDFYATQRARIGTRFVRAVLESTWEGRSSFTEAFQMLGAKSTDTLDKLGVAVGL